LTTPTYTAHGTAEVPAIGHGPRAMPEAGSAPTWRMRVQRRLIGAAARPRLIQAALDLAAIGFIAIAFTQTAISAEFLFHCVFVMLVLHAFLFGLRGTLLRISLVSIPLIVYAEAKLFGLNEPPLELTEWPLMFVIAALVAWMADRRNSTSHRYATLFRAASERLITVEEDERRRIAGELHDGVGQVLTALTLTLDAAASERDVTGSRKRIRSARMLADTALAGTRDLSHRIRPARLEERGLVAAVRDLAAHSGFTVIVRADGAAAERDLLDPTVLVEAYRIIQEALANAARHSGAAEAHVSIRRLQDQLVIVVEDAGAGFDPAGVSESGIGLAGMLERARLLSGGLSIESVPGAGTRVTLSVPIGHEAPAP
jgi:signal transduction histidine kinase